MKTLAVDGEARDRRYPWYALGVLMVAYTFSYLDRQALTLLVGPIRTSLHISDTQLSLLHGFAFAIFYTVLGLPLGRMLDQYRRTGIIAAGVAGWSVMTAVCGISHNFAQMFLARIGVGVGEAALSPGAYSLISDYFEARLRPLALSTFLGAIYIGSGLATIAGGALIAAMPAARVAGLGLLQPWQMVFIVIGLPGLAVAIWVWSLREPGRTGAMADAPPAIRGTLRHVGTHWRAYALMVGGYALFTMMWNAALAWLPTYFIRVHGWSAGQVGARLGVVIMTSGTIGVLSGGWLATALCRRGRMDSNILTGIIAGIVAVPAGLAIGPAADATQALAAAFVFQFGCAMPFGAAAAALQDITPNQMRGQVTAIYQFCCNMMGLGLGPTIVAVCTDHLFHNDLAVGRSIMIGVAASGPMAIVLLWAARRAYVRALQVASN